MTLPSEARRNRGETSIQAVLLVPAILGIFFLGVHATALAHGGHIAAFSNNEGNDVVRALNEMEQVVSDLGSRMFSAPSLEIGNKSVRVTVKVAVQSVVPFLPTSVSRSATVSREQFLMEQDR